MAERSDAGLRALMMGAAFVVIIAGLRAAAPVLMPVLISIFVAVLSLAPISYLQKRGIPDWLAGLLVFSAVVITLMTLSVFVGASLQSFDDNLPGYEARLKDSFSGLLAWAEDFGIGADVRDLRDSLDTGLVMGFAKDLVVGMSGFLSNTFFVLLTVAFILAEATSFPRKLRAASGGKDHGLEEYTHVIGDIQTYLAIKTKISVATGCLALILCLVVGVDYPLLWGLVAFLLNFVPTLGSIIAALPVILLAFIQLSWGHAVAVLLGYTAINVGLGNILEPRLMGRRLGLSALVVFLSLVFWGWVFGPAGMLLSVPLTMVAKIFLEANEDLRWIAVLLGPADEVEHHEHAAQSRRESVDDASLVGDSLDGSSSHAPKA